MNIAAYCRVSTDKSDQLNSLEAQKKFFAEFTERNGHNLVRLYADEGISGTKIKNRKEFQKLMRDAKQGLFDMVVVKDISRFARNTVDFLQSIRALKALGIETTFLTANMTVLGNSEFVLTIFGALAQEESANTWVCSGHNGKGVDNCPNAVTIDEAELIQALDEYFKEILKDKKNIINRIVKEFNRIYKKKEDNEQYENELMTELAKLKKTREKYMDMYTDDLISREELNEKIGGMKKKIEKLENELKLVEYNLNKGDQLEEIVQHTFKNIEGITSVADMTNEQLKQIIQKIEVDKEGNVDIYLRIFGDLGLDDSVLISYDHT